MQATLVNDWWMTTDSGGSMGSTDTSGITDKQKHNAEKVYNYFSALGWSLSAIAGMLGNMQVESRVLIDQNFRTVQATYQTYQTV